MQPLSAPLRPGGFLSILFNQPVVAGTGRIRFKQVFPGTSFFGAEERVVAGGAIVRDEANHSVMRLSFEELGLNPNARYAVTIEPTLVKNSMWPQLEEDGLAFEITTEDEHCVPASSYALPVAAKHITLCRYEGGSVCRCHFVLLWGVCCVSVCELSELS